MVFGRRKIGKTIIISRDIELLSYPAFRKRLTGLMKKPVTVVIDEF